MKVIKRKSIDGRKLVLKELSEKNMKSLCITSKFILTLDGDIEWEGNTLEEMLEFMDNWGQ